MATTSLPVDRLTATDCNAAARAKIEMTRLGLQCQTSLRLLFSFFFFTAILINYADLFVQNSALVLNILITDIFDS